MTVRDLACVSLGKLPRVEDPRAHMRAARYIEDRISSGEYEHGQRLNVGLIADESGVYRAAVARALNLLAGRGLVTFYPGLGWYVV